MVPDKTLEALSFHPQENLSNPVGPDPSPVGEAETVETVETENLDKNSSQTGDEIKRVLSDTQEFQKSQELDKKSRQTSEMSVFKKHQAVDPEQLLPKEDNGLEQKRAQRLDIYKEGLIDRIIGAMEIDEASDDHRLLGSFLRVGAIGRLAKFTFDHKTGAMGLDYRDIIHTIGMLSGLSPEGKGGFTSIRNNASANAAITRLALLEISPDLDEEINSTGDSDLERLVLQLVIRNKIPEKSTAGISFDRVRKRSRILESRGKVNSLDELIGHAVYQLVPDQIPGDPLADKARRVLSDPSFWQAVEITEGVPSQFVFSNLCEAYSGDLPPALADIFSSELPQNRDLYGLLSRIAVAMLCPEIASTALNTPSYNMPNLMVEFFRHTKADYSIRKAVKTRRTTSSEGNAQQENTINKGEETQDEQILITNLARLKAYITKSFPTKVKRRIMKVQAALVDRLSQSDRSKYYNDALAPAFWQGVDSTDDYHEIPKYPHDILAICNRHMKIIIEKSGRNELYNEYKKLVMQLALLNIASALTPLTIKGTGYEIFVLRRNGKVSEIFNLNNDQNTDDMQMSLVAEYIGSKLFNSELRKAKSQNRRKKDIGLNDSILNIDILRNKKVEVEFEDGSHGTITLGEVFSDSSLEQVIQSYVLESRGQDNSGKVKLTADSLEKARTSPRLRAITESGEEDELEFTDPEFIRPDFDSAPSVAETQPYETEAPQASVDQQVEQQIEYQQAEVTVAGEEEAEEEESDGSQSSLGWFRRHEKGVKGAAAAAVLAGAIGGGVYGINYSDHTASPGKQAAPISDGLKTPPTKTTKRKRINFGGFAEIPEGINNDAGAPKKTASATIGITPSQNDQYKSITPKTSPSKEQQPSVEPKARKSNFTFEPFFTKRNHTAEATKSTMSQAEFRQLIDVNTSATSRNAKQLMQTGKLNVPATGFQDGFMTAMVEYAFNYGNNNKARVDAVYKKYFAKGGLNRLYHQQDNNPEIKAQFHEFYKALGATGDDPERNMPHQADLLSVLKSLKNNIVAKAVLEIMDTAGFHPEKFEKKSADAANDADSMFDKLIKKAKKSFEKEESNKARYASMSADKKAQVLVNKFPIHLNMAANTSEIDTIIQLHKMASNNPQIADALLMDDLDGAKLFMDLDQGKFTRAGNWINMANYEASNVEFAEKVNQEMMAGDLDIQKSWVQEMAVALDKGDFSEARKIYDFEKNTPKNRTENWESLAKTNAEYANFVHGFVDDMYSGKIDITQEWAQDIAKAMDKGDFEKAINLDINHKVDQLFAD